MFFLNYNCHVFNIEESELLEPDPIFWCSLNIPTMKIARKLDKYGLFDKASHAAIIPCRCETIIAEVGDGILEQRETVDYPTLGWDVFRDLLIAKAGRVIPLQPELLQRAIIQTDPYN